MGAARFVFLRSCAAPVSPPPPAFTSPPPARFPVLSSVRRAKRRGSFARVACSGVTGDDNNRDDGSGDDDAGDGNDDAGDGNDDAGDGGRDDGGAERSNGDTAAQPVHERQPMQGLAECLSMRSNASPQRNSSRESSPPPSPRALPTRMRARKKSGLWRFVVWRGAALVAERGACG